MATPETQQDLKLTPQQRWYRKNVEKVAAYKAFQRYGVTEEQLRKMEQEQKGLCAICHQPPPVKKPTLHIDHDHKTGKARRLLCTRCNLMIGMALENPEILRAGAEYLEAHR